MLDGWTRRRLGWHLYRQADGVREHALAAAPDCVLFHGAACACSAIPHRGEEAAKGSMPPEHATKETANQKAHPVFLNTTQRPGHVENCPQSEESREERRGREERGEETREETTVDVFTNLSKSVHVRK